MNYTFDLSVDHENLFFIRSYLLLLIHMIRLGAARAFVAAIVVVRTDSDYLKSTP